MRRGLSSSEPSSGWVGAFHSFITFPKNMEVSEKSKLQFTQENPAKLLQLMKELIKNISFISEAEEKG